LFHTILKYMQNNTLESLAHKTPRQLGVASAGHTAKVVGLFLTAAVAIAGPITWKTVTVTCDAIGGAAIFGFVCGYGIGFVTQLGERHSASSHKSPTRLEL
jgi:hypothetical protein